MIKPTISNLNANSVGIINAILDNTPELGGIPHADETTESIKNVGTEILSYQPRMNAFISALVNRIARVVVTSKMYRNPWAFMKKGVLETGETIEEIFVNIANAYTFKPEDSEQRELKRYIPDVRSMFHAMNLQTMYPVTISEAQLRQAFTSMDGVTDLIARIVNSVYSASNYDEFIMMKYVLATLALKGSVPVNTISAVVDENTGKQAIASIKAVSNKMRFMSNEYTIAGNKNFIEPENLYVITTADFDAVTDVGVLAMAFNLDKDEFLGRRVMVDSFAFNDGEIGRLNELLADDPTVIANGGVAISSADNTALATVQGFIVDKDFIQVYDVLNQFTEKYVASGLYWNEFFHVWRIYSASPFVNTTMFVTSGGTVSAVTITAPATASAGETVKIDVDVTRTAFANGGVTLTIAPDTGATGSATISDAGLIVFSDDASGDFIVTATSVANTSVHDTATITVS